jgi:hypothetical protein
VERLRLGRVDIEALPQTPSKAILLSALDDVIADIEQGPRRVKTLGEGEEPPSPSTGPSSADRRQP